MEDTDLLETVFKRTGKQHNAKTDNTAIQVKAKQANGICHKLFRQLNILLLQSQYIFSLLVFIIKNRDQFLSISEVQDINTRVF